MAMVENAYENDGKFFVLLTRIEEKENLTETMQMGTAHIILNRRIKIHEKKYESFKMCMSVGDSNRK